MKIKRRIINFLKNDYQWVDISWLIIFIIFSILTPYIMLWNGFEWGVPKIWIKNPLLMIWITITSSVIGLIGAYLMLRKNRWNGIVGAISNLLLGFIYLVNGLYLMGGINIILAPSINIYLFIRWTNKIDVGNHITPKKLKKEYAFYIFLGIIVISILLGSILVFLPGGDPTSYVSWLDAIMFVTFIFATLLAVYAYKEQYWIWLSINIVSTTYITLQVIGIGISEPALYLVPTLVLMIGYGFTGIWGNYKWRR